MSNHQILIFLIILILRWGSCSQVEAGRLADELKDAGDVATKRSGARGFAARKVLVGVEAKVCYKVREEGHIIVVISVIHGRQIWNWLRPGKGNCREARRRGGCPGGGSGDGEGAGMPLYSFAWHFA
jgi:hypothetical protein